MDEVHSGTGAGIHFKRAFDVDTFKIFVIYFFVGIGLLFYWQGTWTCLAFLYHFSPRLEVNIFVYISSSFTLFGLASFAPRLVAHLQPNNPFLVKGLEKTICGKPEEINGGDIVCLSESKSCKPMPDAAESGTPMTYYRTCRGSVAAVDDKLPGCCSLEGSRRTLQTLELKIVLYVFELANVGSWFGPWGLIDYLGEHYLQPLYIYLAIHVLTTAILVGLGRLPLVVVTPGHSAFQRDKQVNLFMPLLFRSEAPHDLCALLGRSFVRVFFLGNMVFLFWYSSWGLINGLVDQMLPAGIADLPVAMLPFVCLILFIPNFFVLSCVADETNHVIGRPALAYVQGLVIVTFWIFGWNFSSWLLPFEDQEWEVAYPFLCHAVSFLAFAACGIAINLGI